MRQPVLLAGAGIGGLAAALACARVGVPVQLFERSPTLAEMGAGIQLGPNVTRLLEGWGLQTALQAVAAYPENLLIRSAESGTLLGRLRLGEQALVRYGAPYATVHRADLQALLLQAVQACGSAHLQLGQAITGFDQDAARACLHHADGHQTQGPCWSVQTVCPAGCASSCWATARRKRPGTLLTARSCPRRRCRQPCAARTW